MKTPSTQSHKKQKQNKTIIYPANRDDIASIGNIFGEDYIFFAKNVKHSDRLYAASMSPFKLTG